MRNLQQAKTLYDEFNDLDDILKDDIEYKTIMMNYIYGNTYCCQYNKSHFNSII